MLLEIGLICLTLFLILYRYVTKNFDHWKRQGVPHIEGHFPYGSHIELLTQSKHFNVLVKENYERFKNEDFHGMFLFGKPVLVVQNLELIRNIMVKDFNHFVDRNCAGQNMMNEGGELDQLWGKGMTDLCGDEWKNVRFTFTPIFTSGKMKCMLKFMLEVSTRLREEINLLADRGQHFELKELFGKFSIDSLATCAFGINPNSFKEVDGPFIKNAASIFQVSAFESLKLFSRLIPGSGWLQKKLKIDAFKPKETRFFRDIVISTIQHRRKTGQKANDLIDLMLDCMKPSEEGNVENKDEEGYGLVEQDVNLKFKKKRVELNEDIVVSNCLLFLAAGYDTTGKTLAFLGYYLSKHPEIQANLQEEIDQAYSDNDGKVPEYNTIQELPYLDMCVLETLRLSGGEALIRACTKDYVLPNTDITIKRDDLVIIPGSGIHLDERYYPDPDTFNPENFRKERKQSRSPYTFLGFGQGPRACIGMRFALLATKVAIMGILRSYSFVYSEKNPADLVIDPASMVGYVKEGLHAKVVRRSED